MFNLFKKKVEIPKIEVSKREEIYAVDIYFKNGKTDSFTIKHEKTFPFQYRKLYNWYFNRSSDSYCFRYSNGGMYIFKRDEISRINFYKY
jgi:hypothetical protein